MGDPRPQCSQHQCWFLTVPQILYKFYLGTVYFRTEKIHSDICHYSFRFQSHLHAQKNITTTHYLPSTILYSAISSKHYAPTTVQSQTTQILFFYHTYFLYSNIISPNFQLYTNLSRSYSRNPWTPANHSMAPE